VDTIALAGDCKSPREALFTSTLGAPMPPHERIWGRRIYAKAARGGGFIFTAGRTNNVIGAESDAIVRDNLDLPYNVDRPTATCRMILDYLRASLASLGADLSHVVKADVHLSDLRQIASIDRVWREAFTQAPPARIFIPCAFPTTYTSMEIEFIALDPAGPWDKETIGAPGEPPARGHEPLGCRAGPYLFFSGLSASDGREGLAPEARANPAYPFHEQAVRKETEYVAQRISSLMPITKGRLLRRRLMAPTLEGLGIIDEAWRDFFGDVPPTTAFRTPSELPVPATSVQFDLIGWLD
jgi:enamine deaminase RidA (YjgF/YER057c/UK114 family)